MKNVNQDELDFDAETEVAGETKAQRFKRVVNPRVKVAVKRMRMIRQMFEGQNANNYEFTQEQADKLYTTLYDEVAEIKDLMFKRLSNVGKTVDDVDEI